MSTTTIKQIVKMDYCCEYMKEAVEGSMNAVHLSETYADKEISQLYMTVETNYGKLPCFLKFCPECGTKLSNHKWPEYGVRKGVMRGGFKHRSKNI